MSPRRLQAVHTSVGDLGGHLLPSDLFNHLADEVGDLLIHGPALVRVREALSSELLLDGIEAFVQVVAVVCGTGTSGGGRGCGVHGEGERGSLN